MNTKERRTLILVIVLALACLAAGLILNASASTSKQAREPSAPLVFTAGSTVELNSASNEARYIRSDGVEAEVEFGWSGSMELTVEKAVLFKGTRAAEKAGELGAVSHEDDDRLLLVTCRLKNVDATPTRTDNSGRAAFSASVFSVPDLELRYFSASDESNDAHDYFSFQLDKNEEIEFTLGYPWQSSKNGALGEIPEFMAPGIDGAKGHYLINLATTIEE